MTCTPSRRCGSLIARLGQHGRVVVAEKRHLTHWLICAQVLRLLLSAEGSVSAEDCCGVTPLAHAVTGGHCACARILLAAGANITLFPGETCTAADLKGVLSTDATLAEFAARRWAVWKSNFGRPTPSTRCCPRGRVGSMVWRLMKVHGIFLNT